MHSKFSCLHVVGSRSGVVVVIELLACGPSTGQKDGMDKSLTFKRFDWIVLRIYATLTIFPSYRELEAVDTQSLKLKWRNRDSPCHTF